MYHDLSLQFSAWTVAMLLKILVISHLVLLTTPNPFHKYPYVFLLDVGNEELDKVSTEQIRVSLPGGSLALRYPAVGDGDTIVHVRVSGIDFGTELKSNIVDGGPGYKYVVLVFMGNPGVPYDAVVSIQTLPDDKVLDNTIEDTASEDISIGNSNEGDSEDSNNSAEEIDSSEAQYGHRMKAEAMQSSSNVYQYVENEESNNDYNDDTNEAPNTKDIHKPYRVHSDGVNQEVAEKDYIDGSDFQQGDNQNEDPKAEKYTVDEYNYQEKSYDDNEAKIRVDDNLYDKYKALRPHLYNDVNVYPQSAYETNEQRQRDYEEDPVEIDQMFNDEEIHNDAGKYEDSNSNYFDSDDSSAVAS